MDFKDHFDLDTAMKILKNQTVDSKLWAEAVEWLLLYGPPEVSNILLQASGHATEQCFPELREVNYTHDGQPCYDIKHIAEALGISRQEAQDTLADKEIRHKTGHFFDDGSSGTTH